MPAPGFSAPAPQLPSEARRRFRDQLLGHTVRHAARSSAFYGARFGRAVLDVRTTEDLPLLPVVTKQEILDHHEDMVCGSHELPALVQHTTGATGSVLRIERSAAEVRFVQAFFARMAAARQGPRPVVLHLADLYHGAPLPVPGHEHVVTLGVTDDVLLEGTVGALIDDYAFPGVERHASVLVGLVPYVKVLTAHLLQIGFDFSRSHVRLISPTCTALSPRWRALLSSTWGAQVVDRYSLSEVFGGATLCLECESYHFDTQVVPEVLDLRTREPVRSGLGVLTLTSLYPFVQRTPMVRYWTDDLVQVVDSPCTSDLSVRFRGRLPNAVFVERGAVRELVLEATVLLDVLDDFPEISASDRFKDIRRLDDHSAPGTPKYQVKVRSSPPGGAATVTVAVELRYSPTLYPDHVAHLAGRLHAGLLDRSDTLSAAVGEGRVCLDLAFSGPGTLPDPALKI